MNSNWPPSSCSCNTSIPWWLCSVLITPFHPNQPSLTSSRQRRTEGRKWIQKGNKSAVLGIHGNKNHPEMERQSWGGAVGAEWGLRVCAIILCNSRAKPLFSSSNWASLGSKAICNQRALRSSVAVERGAPLIKPLFPSSLLRWHFCVGASYSVHRTPTAGEKY